MESAPLHELKPEDQQYFLENGAPAPDAMTLAILTSGVIGEKVFTDPDMATSIASLRYLQDLGSSAIERL